MKHVRPLKIVHMPRESINIMYSQRKISFFVFFAIALMLSVVIIFSFGQYRLNGQYRLIIKQSEKAIFEFNAIREQMVGALIKKDFANIFTIAYKLNNLNSTLVVLLENELIPAESKLDFANRVDLTEMVLVAQNLGNIEDKTKSSLRLQSQMRGLAEYLLRFDRVIVGQMKAEVVDFQKIIIGILGSILSFITFFLLFLYKRTIFPLQAFLEQIKKDSVLPNGLLPVASSSSEIEELRGAMNDIIKSCRSSSDNEGRAEDQEANDRLAGVVNAITNLLNGIINYAQLLSDSCDKQGEKSSEKKMIGNIISYAERISALLSKS